MLAFAIGARASRRGKKRFIRRWRRWTQIKRNVHSSPKPKNGRRWRIKFTQNFFYLRPSADEFPPSAFSCREDVRDQERGGGGEAADDGGLQGAAERTGAGVPALD